MEILQGDCQDVLKTLPSDSVHCVVTSPPYWGLRDYGVPGQIGLEPTPEEYVAKMVKVFQEVKRVLRPDGTLWLNLGDSYTIGNRTCRDTDKKLEARGMDTRPATPYGLKPKDLVGIPWKVAFSLQADGWYLRSDIIWHKPNVMPESVRDRPTKSHEYLFLLAKSDTYYYDQEAIKENKDQVYTRKGTVKGHRLIREGVHKPGSISAGFSRDITTIGRNKRTVWTIVTRPYKGAHFATFPPDLVRPCILAGTSEKGCCPKCGNPWKQTRNKTDWKPTCSCVEPTILVASPCSTVWADVVPTPVPCTVLDPFGGSGTTGAVAEELGRRGVIIELNPDYCELSRNRKVTVWEKSNSANMVNAGVTLSSTNSLMSQLCGLIRQHG